MGLTDTISGLGLDSILESPQYLPQIPNWEDCEIRPNLPIHESSNSIQFVVGGQNDPNFTIPSTMQLCGVVEIRNHDGSRVVAADEVSVVNLFPHALFEAVDVFINNKQISDTGRNYHHKVFCIVSNLMFKCFHVYISRHSSQITLVSLTGLKQRRFREIISCRIL